MTKVAIKAIMCTMKTIYAIDVMQILTIFRIVACLTYVFNFNTSAKSTYWDPASVTAKAENKNNIQAYQKVPSHSISSITDSKWQNHDKVQSMTA